MSMFMVRCPHSFLSPLQHRAIYFNDYEHLDVADITPFCGRSVTKNPDYIFSKQESGVTINILQHKHVSIVCHLNY